MNLFGQLAVTQAFLPLVRMGGGRIVNVGSIGGRIVLPLHGAYSASKFGMEAVTDALRIELDAWGIHVAHVDPGATDTAIFDKTLTAIDDAKAQLDGRGITLYDGHFDAVRELVTKTAADADPPIKVAEAIGDALMSTPPEGALSRRPPGEDARRGRAHPTRQGEGRPRRARGAPTEARRMTAGYDPTTILGGLK